MEPSSASPRERAEEALCNLGFNRSAARLYLSLMERHPATGYELAARSGVPRAAIYHTLNTLEKEGLISRIQDNPARYEPLEPSRLADMLLARFKRHIDALREGLESMARPAPPAGTWNVVGYERLLEQAQLLIGSARKTLAVSGWRRELQALQPELKRAVQTGCDVVIFSFTAVPPDCGRAFSYDISEAELERHWPHKLILVADGEAALMGNASPDTENRAVLTRESALVEMAVSNIVMDLTLWGQRFQQDTTKVVSSLTSWLAPVEKLAQAAGTGADASSLSVD